MYDRRHGHAVFVPFIAKTTMKFISFENPIPGLNLDKFLQDFAYGSWLPSPNHDENSFGYTIVDSCDGLLLINIMAFDQIDASVLKVELLVCNPVRGLCKLLSNPTFDIYTTGHIFYDHSINKYKIICAGSLSSKGDIHFYIIELDNSKHQITPWKKLELLLPEISGNIKNIILYKQNVHWLITSNSGYLTTLLTLDITTGKFKITECPRLPFNTNDNTKYIGFNGKFYHLYQKKLGEFELWHLKFLNDEPTWFMHKITTNGLQYNDIYFVGELEEDKKIVFVNPEEGLVVYDITKGRCNDILMENLDSFCIFFSPLCVNNLFSYERTAQFHFSRTIW
ncbi:hypothetical protein SAY87_022392 [Trapa incisa]|uniref:F-box associated beta-propeller type 1 domain-containing protein n=1 Tax=Trapa incisa TaxID=236973 RepID=A0AAN7K6Y8_9MYRT|nr:hypothetical protein SAY87_022392 [Trapa incisa]